MGVLERLRARREQLLTEARAVVDPAADMKREMTADEQRRYDGLVDEIDRLDERIKEVSDGERRAADAAAAMGRYSSGRRYRRNDELADSFRSMILERNPRPIDVHWEEPRSAYQPGVERRDLVTTAPANMSPVSFYGQLVEHMVESSAVLRAGATLLTTTSGETLRVPRTSALSTAAIVSEAAAIPESDPTLSSVSLGAFKYGFLVQVSTELVQDAGVDLEG
ncbi:phage major capsid protein, partial [Streptomyces sp. KR55]|uniref:phage major capsid protein n=1 Tax=Streptomyces sp. KR55 TaxID=3457425 RepID=UPI003FD0ED9E